MLPLLITYPEIDPAIFSIELPFGDPPFQLALRWYALAYIAGILLGFMLIKRFLKTPALWGGEPPMSETKMDDLLTYLVFGVVLGGRLGYVLFYDFGYFLDNPSKILRIDQGGMSFHGGFLGVIIATLFFCRKHNVKLGLLSNAIAAVAPIGLFFGRMANFINAELYGRVTDMPWAMQFPYFYNGEKYYTEPRHPSQLYEAILEGLVLGVVMWVLISKRHALGKPWRLVGVFFLGYGLARFFVEHFRQADAQFITDMNPMGYIAHFGPIGITMGQTLSLPMVVIGLVILFWSRADSQNA